MDRNTIYANVKESRDRVYKEEFFLRLWKAISERRENIRDKCEENKDDIRFYQGKARILRDIMALPDLIIQELQDDLKE